MAYGDDNPRVKRNPLAGYTAGAINGVNDPTQPGRNIPASNYGAINGVNDPTQSAYRAPAAQPTNPLVTSTFSPQPGSSQPQSNGSFFPSAYAAEPDNSGGGARPLFDAARNAGGAVSNALSVIRNTPFNGGTSPIGSQTPTRGNTFADRATAAGGAKQADGSYAFSNIPNQPGYNSKLNDLGNTTNVVSAQNFANPGIGTLGGPTPTVEQTSGIRFGNQSDTGFDMSPGNLAQRQSRSDLASILTEDPRSAMGIAARNARMNLADIRMSRGRYGGQSSPYEQALGALTNSAASPIGVYEHDASNNARLDEARLHNQGGLAETNLRGQYGLAETNARVNAEMNKPEYQTDANGNLVRVQGTQAQGVMQGKNPLAVTGKINAPEEKAYQQRYNDVYKTLTGQGKDPDEADQLAEKAANNHIASLRSRGTSSSVTPPPEAAAFLKQNPKLKDQFDAKYGKGAADKILNG